MSKKTKLRTLQEIGGAALLKKRGRAFYKSIAIKYWSSPAGKKRRKAMKAGKIFVR